MNRYAAGIRILLKKPHYIFFILGCLALFIGGTNYHSSILVKDYKKTEAEIEEVTPVQVLWHQSYVTRYNYIVRWEKDGQEYKKKMTEQVDQPEEGSVTIWVRPDQKEIALSNSVKIGKEVPTYLAVGAILVIIGLIIWFVKRPTHQTNEERMDAAINMEIGGGLVFVLSLVLLGIVGYGMWKQYKNVGYYSPLDIDLAVTAIITGCGSAAFFIVGRKRMR